MDHIKWINNEPMPSLDTVLDAVRSLPSLGPDSGVTLQLDEEFSVIIYHVLAYGFLVTGHVNGDTDYYVLVDRLLGDECRRVWCAGDYMDRPRYVFVSKKMALEAIKYLYDTGRRNPALEWLPDSNCWCENPC